MRRRGIVLQKRFTCRTRVFYGRRCWARTSDLLLVREIEYVSEHRLLLQKPLSKTLSLLVVA